MKENKKKAYSSPVIAMYALNDSGVDFLIASGEDPDQGEWDPQPDYYVIPSGTDGEE
jgi:hypothetical protein